MSVATANADVAAPWRVLLVDDSRDDADLAQFALQDDGLAIVCRRVANRTQLAEALAAFTPQIVLSDINLPGFSGQEALAQVRAHDPSLPFVFLTGSLIGSEATPAAEALVLKDELHRLPEVLRTLLRND